MKREISFSESFKDHVFGKVFVSLDGEQTSLPTDDCSEIISECHEGAVCIASGTCSETVIRISTGLPQDRRQYLLFSDTRGTSSVMGNKFIRITKIGQRGMVVINIVDGRPDVAWLFSSPEATEAYRIDDKEQCETLYRSFCNLFWIYGDTEYRGNSTAIKADQVISQEIPMTDRCCMKGTVTDIFDRFGGGAYYADDPMDIPESFDKVFVRDCDNPGRWANGGRTLKLYEGTHGFSMVVKGKGGYLLPSRADGDAVNWSVHMTQDQISDLKDTFEPKWEYREDVDLNKTIGKEIRYLSKTKDRIPIKKKDSVSDEFTCSTVDEYLDDGRSAQAYLRTTDLEHPVAETVAYNITIRPPGLPQGAVKDGLYDSWEEAIDKWKGALDILSEDGDKQIKPVLDGTERIGLGNELSDLKAKVKELSDLDISVMGNTRIEASRKSYISLCDEFEEFRTKCDKAVKRKEFEDKKNEDIVKTQSELDSLNAKHTELTEKLKGKDQVLSKDTARKGELDKNIADLDQKIDKTGKKDKKKGELQAERKKLIDERDSITKEIKEITNLKTMLEQNTKDIQSKELKLKEVKASEFEYRPNPLHTKNKIVPKSFSFPDEPLPRDSRFVLYSVKGQRYITAPGEESDKILNDESLRKDSDFYDATIVVR